MELVLSLLATAAAVGSVVAAIIASNRAEAASERAANAEQRAVAAAERAAAANATIATIQSAIFDGPPWTVTWYAGDTFLVTNASPIDALEVQVDAFPEHLTLQVDETRLEPFTLGAKSAFTFLFSPLMSDGIRRDLVVRWKRPGSDEVLEWMHPIPVRPKKA